MENQALFSSNDKSKKLKGCLLQFLFGALRVKIKLRLTKILLSLLAVARNMSILTSDLAKAM